MTTPELLTRKGIAYRLSGHELAVCCLFCTAQGESLDERFRLYLNLNTGAGLCFNCGWRSRYALQQVLRRLKLPQQPTDFEVASKLILAAPKLPVDFLPLTEATSKLDLQALRYVLKRGVTQQQILDKRLGVSFVGEFAYRIIFPIWEGSSLQGFTARSFLGTEKVKYLHSKGNKYLFNLANSTRVILSEGVFKALRIEQLALPYDSAACLGHSLTAKQLEQLQQHKVKQVVLWPDPDSVGLKGFLKIAEELHNHVEVKIVWPMTQPADEASPDSLLRGWKHRKAFGATLARKILRASQDY
jgi:hypothetical protein